MELCEVDTADLQRGARKAVANGALGLKGDCSDQEGMEAKNTCLPERFDGISNETLRREKATLTNKHRNDLLSRLKIDFDATKILTRFDIL